MTLKNQKHHPKNQNQHEIKNQIKLRFVITNTFKVKKKKKTLNTNSSDQIEPYDTNIDNFGCLY
jgi:hypothetical protein